MDSTRGPAAEPALPAPFIGINIGIGTGFNLVNGFFVSVDGIRVCIVVSPRSGCSFGNVRNNINNSSNKAIPLSSSPGLPRPPKRQNVGTGSGSGAHLRYPTPVPTSSTGILSSSPLRDKMSIGLLERAPLSAVPSIELNENGETLLMGRSSNSSHFQLSANRLISRVHVRARYVQAATPLEASKIEITCNGWNGLKLHCQGRTWELLKGDSFTSETEGTEIMVDSGRNSDDAAASPPRSKTKKVTFDGKRRQARDEEKEDEKEDEQEEKEEAVGAKGKEEEDEEDEEEEPTRIPSEADAAISNHVVNQLAFSRLSSTPLSTIMHNLPAEQIKDISRDALRLLIETTPCIGIIKRQGKDAAGKPLESEYYYIPEDDTDMQRRAAVVDGLRKPSLRACRKQHKQYYWKRPKTP
ncbi:hypothetical protein M440DRAFT_1391539 [Trichoderma longibrachiatum ATCC 18648]|uniref:FHA domain-containing protein n=1 Tax=Trichoderma longibrachiatum ATCC 18648 TaxID=983965 RepID=A0A2T4C644_TRILO|nr:hypothetical protein M440DRAFT_1391539 [Trichoderma longibrachiatum ATCC 18648]